MQLGIKVNRELLWLCRKCHDVLELFIPSELVEDVSFYRRVVDFFLGDPTILTVYKENPRRFVQRLRSGKLKFAI